MPALATSRVLEGSCGVSQVDSHLSLLPTLESFFLSLQSLFYHLSLSSNKILFSVSSPTLLFFVDLVCQKEKRKRKRGGKEEGERGEEGGKKEERFSPPSLVKDY